MNAYTNSDYGSKESLAHPRTGEPMQSSDIDALLETPLTPSLSDDAFRHVNETLLAKECVKKIYDYPAIAKRFGLTMEQFIMICKRPGFKKIVAVERAQWEGPDNAKTRVQTYYQEGAAMVSSAVVAMVNDTTLTPTTRLEANKQVLMAAGLTNTGRGNGDAAASGTGFAVNFHFASTGKVERMTLTQPDEGDATVAIPSPADPTPTTSE